jgi:hypothetical protein
MEPGLRIFPSSNAEHQQTSGKDDINRRGEVVEEVPHRGRILWGLVFLVIAGLIGASWYGYRAIGTHSALLAQIPVLQQRANGTDGRLSSDERKENDWSNDQMSLMERMGDLIKTLSSDVKAARSQAKAAANQVEQRIREELNQGLQRLQGRVENVESVQRETQDRLTAAQTEISSLRQEISGLQKQNAERVTELQQTQGNVDRLNSQLATVNREVVAHTSSLDALNEEVERQPVTFEVSTKKTQQVAPGIYLTVSHTDVTHQKVDGWMQLADEGRFVWIRGLAAQQALTFIPTRENRTHEIVFTGVQEKGVTGYVLLPRSTAAPKSAAN